MGGKCLHTVHTASFPRGVHTGRGLCPHFADRDTESWSRQAEPSPTPLWALQGPSGHTTRLAWRCLAGVGTAWPHQVELWSAPLQPEVSMAEAGS